MIQEWRISRGADKLSLDSYCAARAELRLQSCRLLETQLVSEQRSVSLHKGERGIDLLVEQGLQLLD